MRRTAPLALLALCLTSLSPRSHAEEAPEKDWSHHTGKIEFLVGYDKGVAEAKFTGKPILAFCTTTWCGYCKKMAKACFNDDQVLAAVSEFVPVIVDGDVEKEVCKKFQVTGYPHVVFLSAEEKTLGVIHGCADVKEFLAGIKAARAKLGKEIALTPGYMKLLKARKDLDQAMGKKGYAAALGAIQAIEKIHHEGPDSLAAARAKEALSAEAKAALEDAEAKAAEGKKVEALKAFDQTAKTFKGLDEAREAAKRAEELRKEPEPKK